MNVFIDIAGWTLIHFIWQGTVIASAVATLLRLTRFRSPGLRYVVACAGLVAMLAAPFATAYLLRPDAPSINTTRSADPAPVLEGRSTVRGDSALVRSAAGRQASETGGFRAAPGSLAALTSVERLHIDQVLRGITLAWLIGVSVLLARMAAGWWQVRRLHQLAIATPSSRWQTACRRIAFRVGLPAAAHVVESTLVEVPTLVGWLRPAILLPVTAVTALTPAQIEAILAHELAHIRRHDYAINLLQTVAETLLFYHPAVWWLSDRIRAEREHCCDDIAVAVCGDAVGYAQALAELEARRGGRLTAIALASTGGPLLDRVRRILSVPANEQPPYQSWAVTIILTLLCTVGAGSIQHLSWISWQTNARASYDQPPPPPPAAPEPPAPPQPPEPAGRDPWSVPPAPPSSPVPPEPPEPPIQAGASVSTVPPLPPVPPIPPVPPAAIDRVPSPVPPIPPAPPAPPTPPVPPAPPARAEDIHGGGDRQVKWTDGTSRFDVRLHGRITFNDELTDVASISDDGYLTLREWSGLVPRTIEVRSSGGVVTRKFYVGGRERPYDDEARRWLAERLPVLVRRSGLGAEQRVKSILAKKGVGGVLDEIELLEGDYARRLYFNALVDQVQLDSTAVQPVLLRLGQQMKSDYERAQVLQHIASRVRLDQRGAQAYIRAMASMKSDYERRQALTALMARRPAVPGVADAALDGVGDMRSDYERSEVLRSALTSGTIEQPDAVFAAVGRMTSSYEQRRVLLEALAKSRLADDAKRGFLMAAASVPSDYDCSEILIAYVKAHGVDASIRRPFFAAVRTVDSDYERRRVLAEVAQKGSLSREVQESVFDLVGTMRSDYERAEILLAFVKTHAVGAQTRQAFLNAAERIKSPHEQNRVLAALVTAGR